MSIRKSRAVLRHKEIEFLYEPKHEFSKRPVPASKALPNWYNKLATRVEGSQPWDASTVKGCMPFLDAMTLGYIIPLWCDILVSPSFNEKEEVQPEFTWGVNQLDIPIAGHSANQTEGTPIMNESIGDGGAYKFTSPWIIRTPPGYSCLFTAPLNNPNPQFEVVSGVVATDNYMTPINFPFVWKDGTCEGMLTRGMPIIQVIPFARDQFSHVCKPLNAEEANLHLGTSTALSNSFANCYKDEFRKYNISK